MRPAAVEKMKLRLRFNDIKKYNYLMKKYKLFNKLFFNTVILALVTIKVGGLQRNF